MKIDISASYNSEHFVSRKINRHHMKFSFLPDRITMKWWLAKLQVFVFLLFVSTFQLMGQITWDGGAGTNNWGDANNWVPDGVPVATDAVTISSNGNLTVNMNGNYSCASLTVNAFGGTGVTRTTQLNILGGFSLAVTGSIQITNTATNGTRTSVINVDGNLSGSGLTYAQSGNDARDCRLLVNTTGIVTVSGNIAMGADPDRSDITVSGNGVINVGGNFSNNGTFVSGTGTVNYNGTAAQQIRSGTYHNLTISDTGTKTIQGNIVINNDLTVNSGSLYFGNTALRSVVVTGNVSGSGAINMSGGFAHALTLNGITNSITTFTEGTGIVTYSGSLQQHVFADTYYNLTLNNSAGFLLDGNVTVSNNLTMTSGNIITGSNYLRLTSGNLTRTSGTIIGRFQRNITATGTNYLFPVGTATNYNPLTARFTDLTSGYLEVQFLPNDIGNLGLPLDDAGSGIFDRHTTGYWRLAALAPMASANYNVTLTHTGFTGVDANARILKRTDGGSLSLDGNHGSVTASTISRTGLANISTTTTDFAVGKANPVIVTQPMNYSGCNATFSIVVSGQPVLSYQWQEDNGGGFADISNGGIYSGANTSSLNLAGATAGMNGYQYRCVVTDGFLPPYTVTSNSATLSVSIPSVTFGYAFTRDLTLNAASGPAPLYDFPALISITLPVANIANANGYDIIFTDNSGNKLDHEIESYNSGTGEFTGWVRIPVLSNSTTTTIKVLYGNSAVSTDPSLASAWKSSYKGVWHLNQADYSDATQYLNNGTQSNTSAQAGIIAGARGFNGSNSYISVSTNGFVPNNNNQTISIWGRYTASPGSTQNLISFQNGGSSSAIQLGFRGGNIVAWIWGGAILADGGAAPSINTWHHYVYTYDGTTSRLYVDGVERANSTIAPQTALPSEGNIGRYNDGEYFSGILDDPRFSVSPYSAGWIQTEYNNQVNPSGFVSMGPETSNDLLSTIGACSSTFILNQGLPAGGVYSGTGVSGTNFNASLAGVGSHPVTYTYTDVNGCSNSAVKNIVVTAVPAAPAAADKSCCITNISDLEASGTNLKWYSDAALSVLAGQGSPFATTNTAAGVYTYWVTQTLNSCESVATQVSLTIYNGITIDTQPQPYGVCSGDNATFTIDVKGFNLTYQWQEDNGGGYSNISDGGVYGGATTATLTLTNPDATFDGRAYRCIISSTCGASPVTSNGALLTFYPVPTPVISGNITACPFETGVVYSTPDTGNEFLWSVSGGTINGSATDASVVVDWGGSGAGTVTVTESVNVTCLTTTPVYNVSISDITAPVISGCPADINADNDAGVCTAAVSWTEPTALDDCLGDMTYTTRSHAPGAVFPLGTTAVTYTFTDLASNTSTCTFNVTVTDNESPMISGCPADINVNNVPGACATIVNWSEPTATDNCTASGSLVWTKSHLPGSLFNVGTTTVTYTVTDANGKSSVCSFDVVVNDNEDPVAKCKDITIYLDALGNASIVPSDINDGSTDNCGIASMTALPNTFSTPDIGPNSVTLTVTDVNGRISTCNSTVTVVGTLPPTAYYSYQTGYWDVASTWTTDPGGTTGPGTTVPGPNDKVVILTGRTVYLQSNVISTNLDVTINSGGVLDQAGFQFTQPLTSLKGGGIHKLASANYPSTVSNTFVTTDGGTTEYNHSGNMSATQATYYNLIIRSAGTVTQVNDITINGNADVKAGKLQINDASNTRRILVINGDLTVDAGAQIGVGTGVTNTVTNPATAPAGEAAGFVNYYETQSHRVQIYGNFTNNGIVKFTNLDYPVYNAFPSTTPGTTTGFATVYFSGASDKTVTLNGPTTFYNMVVQKGTDQTFKLTLYSAAYNYFRLFGANTARSETPGANPLVKKALWIRSGTLILQGLSGIPSLSEGNLAAVAGYTTSDYFIPQNGALVLDGGGVIVLSTVDDYTEVKTLYELTTGDNALCGILTTGGYSGLSLLGKLQVNSGYLSTRESSGLLYWSYASGQFILNGGKVDVKQLHNPQGTNIGLISYVQSAGSMILRGRFINTVSYTSPSDVMNPVISSTRANNGIDATAGIGTFSISSNTNNAFGISGGTITVHDVCSDAGTPLAFLVTCPVSNINVSGGTVEFKPKTQTAAEDHYVNSTAPFFNFIVNRESGNASVYLLTNPLTVNNDLTLSNGILNANNLNITIGRHYTVSAGTTYTTGTNTTIFNGSAAQNLTVDLAAALTVNKLTIDKPTGTVLTLAGSQNIINVSSDFRLAAGTLDDNGKTVNIAGNVYNSGIHTGTDPGKIVLNGTALQSIDGNGTFRNIDLLNTDAANAPVSLAANMTVTGVLNLANDKLFNIGIHNLKLESTASVSNYSSLRFIQTSGNSGDGGVTRVYTTSAPFLFPVGAPTITPSHEAKYTPATIGFSSDPSTFGSITVAPVGYEHPVTTVNNLSLTYYWKVRSTGFSGYSSKVTHTFKYDDIDISGTEGNYVPALFNISTSSWNYGQTSDMNAGANEINDWTSPGNSSDFIDADYTAGDPGAFGTPQTYYSRQNGLWSDANTWSLTGHGGAAAGSTPGANDIVIIGNGHTVNLYNDAAYPLNTATVSCASLQIATGSVLDIGNNPGSVFSMVKSHPSGNGTFRLTATKAVDVPLQRVSLFAFPQNSDFSDFNVNLGTTEFYTTTNIGNSLYILPPITYVGNMLLSPLGNAGSGDNMTLQNVSSLTVYGDLSVNGTTAFAAIGLSWNTNNAFYGPQATYTTVEKTVTVKGNLNINGGSFTYYDDIAPQHLIVEGNINIAAANGACIIVWDSNYGFTPYHNGPALSNTLAVGGNIVNNGVTHATYPAVFSGLNLFRNDGSPHYVDLSFFGSNNTTVSGSGNINVRLVTVNKGTSNATTLDLLNGGTMTTLTDNWLTLQNGTLRYMRTNPNSDFTISTTTPFNVPSTAGLYIDLPSNSGNRNILIGDASNNSGDMVLSGKLTLIRGNVYVGRVGGTDANNNDIEYTSSGSSSIDVQGGILFVNGQIRRNPSNAGGILKYSQTGGTVTVNGQAANTTNAKLEVLNTGSDFTMSNGTLTIVRGDGTTATPSTPFGDLYLRPETGSVTGGTILFSQGAIGEQNYFLDANIPLKNLTITGAAGSPATLRLLVSPLTLNGDMTINANSVLNSNNINITFNGNLNNTPGTGGYVYGTNTTTFSATNGSSYLGAQTINGATNFNNLTVSSGTSLTLTNPATINGNLNITSGNFKLGSNSVSLKGNLTNNGTFTDNNNVGEGITLNGTSLQSISGTGAYSRLILINTAGAQILNDITLQEDLTMTTGMLDIKKYLLTLGTNAYLQGAPFSTTKMITSDGVFSNVGIRKFFPIIAAPTQFLYPLGTSGKYTPAELSISNSSSVGSIRVNNINSMHPSVKDPGNALDYYWEIQSSGITNFTGNIVLNYYQEDVVGDEPNYWAGRIEVPGTVWSLSNTVDKTNNKITESYSASNNLSGEYTAGKTSAFFNNVPEFTSTSDGDWSVATNWVQTAGDPVTLTPGEGPNGYIVIIKHVITLDKNYCEGYRTTIEGTLRVESPYYGHNLGTVSGSGKLYVQSGSFPAGVFTSFLACSNNATIEYGGSGTYTIIADLYDNISNVIFSGTGTRVLPNKDLTICNLLKIDGPTLDNSVFNKKLTIQGTMTMVAGSFNSGSGAGATVTFAGSGLQSVGDDIDDYFRDVNAFNNLEINNGAGLRIGDDGAVEIKGNLLLTNGLINTSASRKLTIVNPAINCVIPAGGSVSSFVDGPLIKRISQYDSFLFPIGKSGTPNTLGNNIKISSTQSGPLLWTAEYFTPNPTAVASKITSPLVGVSAQEYYTVTTTAATQATLNLNWTSNSDVTPIITGGISNIRLAHFDTGTGKWVEVPTSSAGGDSFGTATSTSFVTTSATGYDDYTLGSITDLKPRAKFNPAGPVCGTANIPVIFTAPYTIPLRYRLNYTIDGAAQPPVIVTSVPFNLVTSGPGVYKLTDFTYDLDGTPKAGVVDAGTVTVNPVPTTSNAGSDQTLCGVTTTNLASNTPAIGTGEWSFVTELSGPGGTIITPTSPTSQFIGLNGNSYTLRWTISSGTCTSTDDVVINFTILPTAPAAAPNQTFCGPQVFSATVPAANAPVGSTVDWFYDASEGTAIAYGAALTNGVTYYAESNAGTGCKSLTRTAVTVTITPLPTPSVSGINSVCPGQTGVTYSTADVSGNTYSWTIIGGTPVGSTTSSSVVVDWGGSGTGTVRVTETYSGCSVTTPDFNVSISDVAPPTIVCPGNLTATCSITETPAYADLAAFTAAGGSVLDGCGILSSSFTLFSEVSDGLSCPETVTRTYRITDVNGNTNTCTQTITIHDLSSPVVAGSLTASTVEGCAAGAAPAAVTTVAALEALPGGITITDCVADASLVVTSSDAVTGTCPIVVTRTYKVTDVCGNFVNITHTINVTDTQVPVVAGSLTASTVEGCAAGAAPAAVTTVAALEALPGGITITDCVADASLVVTSSDAVTGTCPIVVTRTYKVTDVCGNFVNITHTINVTDTQVPVVAGSLTASTVEGCAAGAAPAAVTTVAALEALPGGITITDCVADASLVVTSSDAVTGTCPIVVTRTYKVTDVCGNFVNITHTINVTDTQVPVVAGSLTASTVEGCAAGAAPAAVTTVAALEALPGGITITDCVADASLVVTSSDAVTGTCPIVVTRTYKVTDVCGNFVNITHTINVTDTQVPVVAGSLTASTVEGCAAGAAPAAVTTVAALEALPGGITITDCVADASLVVTSSDAVTGTCPIVVTRTYKVTDVCGNFVNITHTINVTDTQVPVVAGSLTASTVEGCAAGAAPAAVTTVAALEALPGGITITDCVADASLVVTSSDAVTGTCPIVVTRTYKVTDVCGNFVNITHTINVTDTQVPVVAGSLTASTVEGCAAGAAPAAVTTVAALEALPGGITITDCVADASLVVTSSDAVTGTCPIVVTRTYKVTDVCGNFVNITHTINVTDTQVPVVAGSLTASTVEGCAAGAAPAAVTTVAALEALPGGITITDCVADASLVVTSSDAVTGTCPIVVTRTYKVTDVCGNFVNITHTINVTDTQVPVVAGSLTASTVEGCAAGAAPAAVTTVAALEALPGGITITDCVADASLVVTSSDAVTGTCPIVVTRTYKVTDVCGNFVNITHTINVTDTQVPVVAGSLTASTVEGCAAGAAPAAVTTVAALEALPGGITITDCVADASLVVTSSDAVTGTCPIVVTRTYKVTDVCGNFVNITHTINVTDTQVPVVAGSLTASTVEGCAAGAAPAAVTTVAALEALPGGITITDCVADASLVVTSSDAVTGTCPIVVTRTYKVTDVCGNFVNITHTINVTDTQVPVVAGSLTASTVEGCAAGAAPAAVTTVAALEALPGGITITDCVADASLVVTSSDAVTGTCPIVVTRTYKVTDVCGNFVNITHTINVTDTQVPVVAGSLTASTVEGCAAGAAPAAVTTVAALEALQAASLSLIV